MNTIKALKAIRVVTGIIVLATLMFAPRMEAAQPISISGSLIWTNPVANKILSTNLAYGGYFFIDNVNYAYGYVITNGAYDVWTNGTHYVSGGTNTSWLSNVVATGYIAASNSFYGDGSHLTGLPGVSSNITDSGFTLNVKSNLVASGSIQASNALWSTLAPTSAQTNYTVTLAALPNVSVIHTANTNVFLTFTGTNQGGYQSTIALRGFTNSIVTRFAFNLPSYATNINLVYFVTNGTMKFINAYNLDTTGTNVVFSDAGASTHN